MAGNPAVRRNTSTTESRTEFYIHEQGQGTLEDNDIAANLRQRPDQE